MIIYPAIDILGGRCVRLTQGRYDDSTVYCDEPSEMAASFENSGAEWIHMVDLDGARSGKPINTEAIKKAVAAVSVPIELGGGVRTLDDVETLLEIGVSRVILGTSAVRSMEFVRTAADKYGDKIAVGIDAKDGFVAISGWEEVSSFWAVEFARSMEDCGVKTVIYTDIATDGMLTGPNVSAMEEMVKAVSGMKVIASGGVGRLEDVQSLIPTGVSGVIIGRALYTGNVKLEECLNLVKTER